MKSYIKYFLRKVNTNDEMKQIIPPSREEWEALRAYEPSKINPVYENFVEQVVLREAEKLKALRECSFIIDKVVVDENNEIIKDIEEREDFIRWES